MVGKGRRGAFGRLAAPRRNQPRELSPTDKSNVVSGKTTLRRKPQQTRITPTDSKKRIRGYRGIGEGGEAVLKEDYNTKNL